MSSPKRTPSQYNLGHTRLTDTLAPGTAVTNGQVISVVRPIAGTARGRLRYKGPAVTIAAQFCSPTGDDQYGADNPASVTITGAPGEGSLSFDTYGESYVKYTLTFAANGSIVWVDEMGI